MAKFHRFTLTMNWTGNLGAGTADYRSFSRNHEYSAEGKMAAVLGSSDPVFRGDGSRYSPEELLVGALSSCHMLWMLHLCADAGIVVTEYTDQPEGTMIENADGSGQFADVLLRPRMVITDVSRVEDAIRLHDQAHKLCFIARSMNFPVSHKPVVITASAAAQS